MSGSHTWHECGLFYIVTVIAHNMYVCVSSPEASDMIWTPYNWLNNGYSFYMAAVAVSVVDTAL